MRTEPFVILPAIDLKAGRAVRLRQGEAARELRYSEDPVGVARELARAGASALHVVDLDGAFAGAPAHLPLVARICRETGLPVRLGGGLRREEDLKAAFDAGIAVAILGTVAFEEREERERLRRWLGLFGGRRLAVSLDVRNGAVRTRGWTETSPLSLEEAARRVAEAGLGDLVVTDVERDGELSGPDLSLFRRAARAFGSSVTAAGGIASAEDLERLEAEPSVRGAIVGRALYEGTVPLEIFRRSAP